jgi:integrase
MWSPRVPELGTSGIAHYNEDSALSGTVFFLGRKPLWNVRIAQKSYFEQKRLSLMSRDGLDAHGHDQVSYARGDYPPIRWTRILDKAIFLLAYRHGLRASEVGLLHVEDLDFKTLRIMIHRLKGSHSGEHPLQSDEAKAIKAYLRERRS